MTEITADTPYACGWATDVCCDTLADAYNGADLDKKAIAQSAVDTAAEILYGLSGRQFGLCELTVRPCRTACCDPCEMTGYRWTPVLSGGEWTNVSCSSCSDGCSCTVVQEVVLPGPVYDVSEVKVDGLVLDPSEYRVDNRRTLVRIGRQVPVSGLFVDQGDGTATLGALTATGWDSVNVSGWLASFWDTPPDAVSFTGAPGNALTVMIAPGDTITWDQAGWEAADVSTQAGSSVTITGQSAVGVGASGQLRLTMRAGATTGTVSGTRTGGLSTGFSIIGAASTAREDGGTWPTCQNMTLDADQPGTWEVTYRRGLPLPAAGRSALSDFACEIAKACLNDPSCQLPRRITSITRQGVSMAILDPLPFLQQGRTGLYIVDAWLAAVNPKARVRRAGIYSPDKPAMRRQTWP